MLVQYHAQGSSSYVVGTDATPPFRWVVFFSGKTPRAVELLLVESWFGSLGLWFFEEKNDVGKKKLLGMVANNNCLTFANNNI